MATCDSCGAHVTEGYRRVFATTDGELLGCPDCSARAGGATEGL